MVDKLAVEMEGLSISQAEEMNSNDAAGVVNDDVLVESIWEEINGRVPREQIRRLVLEAAAQFEEAKIKIYVPIFIRRTVLRKIQQWG